MQHGPLYNEKGIFRHTKGFFKSFPFLVICIGFFSVVCIAMPVAADNSTVTTTAPPVTTTTAVVTTTATPAATTTTVPVTTTTAPVTTATATPATTSTTVPATTTTTAPGTTTTTEPVYPIASFTGTPTSGFAPLTVQFTDTSSNSPTAWSWDFGDGSTATDQNPAHTYTTLGTYTVSLTVTGSGDSNTFIQTGYITVSDIPVASFYASETSGTAPLGVQFTDTSSNSPTSWLWDFGDGETSSEQNPLHIYTTPGTYSVSLTAENPGGGNQSTQSDYLVVSAAPVVTEATIQPTETPTAVPTFPPMSFSGTPTSGNAPLTVQFSLSTSGTPTSVLWDFGDGGTSTERNPSYTYVIPGTYTVILTANYPEGSKPVTQSSYITVNGGPGSASSPLSPFAPAGAIGIVAVVSFIVSGRKRH